MFVKKKSFETNLRYKKSYFWNNIYKMKKVFLSSITNKYIVTLIVLILAITFFDRYDLKTQYQLRRELKELEETKKFYVSEIEKNKHTINSLKSDSVALEKFAREKYLMKKNNEDIFLVFTESNK